VCAHQWRFTADGGALYGGNHHRRTIVCSDYYCEFQGNFNFFDPYGGVSFFEHGRGSNVRLQLRRTLTTVRWSWLAGEVFWISVSPPRSFPWEQSRQQRIIYHGSSDDRYMYPSDLSLAWATKSGLGNILYLHNE